MQIINCAPYTSSKCGQKTTLQSIEDVYGGSTQPTFPNNPKKSIHIVQYTDKVVYYVKGADGEWAESISTNTAFREVLVRPTTLNEGELVYFEGLPYRRAGVYLNTLTGIPIDTPVRDVSIVVPGSSDFGGRTFPILQSFNTEKPISTSNIVLDATQFRDSHLVNKISFSSLPNGTITNILNAKLFINLKDTGTSGTFDIYAFPSLFINKSAVLQFFNDLPTASGTGTLKFRGANIIGGPLVASEILIATNKGYTVNIV